MKTITGPITSVIGETECAVCGMTGLSWVNMHLTSGRDGARMVPTASIRQTASGFDADVSARVHPLIYSQHA